MKTTPTAILIAKPPYGSWVLALSFCPQEKPIRLIEALKNSGYEETLVCYPNNGFESRHYWNPIHTQGADPKSGRLDEMKSILSDHGILDFHEVQLTWSDINYRNAESSLQPVAKGHVGADPMAHTRRLN